MTCKSYCSAGLAVYYDDRKSTGTNKHVSFPVFITAVTGRRQAGWQAAPVYRPIHVDFLPMAKNVGRSVSFCCTSRRSSGLLLDGRTPEEFCAAAAWHVSRRRAGGRKEVLN